MSLLSNVSPSTLAAQGLGRVSPPYQEIVPPIHVATTYERAADNSYPGGSVYSRDGNPGYRQVESLLAQLDQGHDALLFGSGMAAASAVFQALQPGAKILVPEKMYWALRKWLLIFTQQWQIDLQFYANEDTDTLINTLTSTSFDLLWIESPANPTWELTDIAKASAVAKSRGTVVAVDATVLTPVLCQPLTLGADIVMHSATKYLNGHSDVIAGALITAADSPYWQRIRTIRALGGAVLGPFESWLLLRGLRTLYPRVKTASDSALQLAQYLESHALVASVSYPGLLSHPQHTLAKQQFKGGFSGMLSVRIKGGATAAIQVAARLQVFKRATSLGSVESLVEHRASVEGEGTLCPDDLLRLSIGVENPTDLIEDFAQALATLEP